VKLKTLISRLSRLKAAYDVEANTVRVERVNLTEAKDRLRTAKEAQHVIQSVAKGVQARIHGRICGLVTRCLQVVFPDEGLEFGIDFVTRRGRTEAEPKFVRKDGSVLKPKQVFGGAVEVAGFALRLACIAMRRPSVRRLLVLDEPFRHVGKMGGCRDRTRALLETLAEELDFQIVLCTHDGELVAGKVIRLSAGRTRLQVSLPPDPTGTS
jgi:hypothetical protein